MLILYRLVIIKKANFSDLKMIFFLIKNGGWCIIVWTILKVRYFGK